MKATTTTSSLNPTSLVRIPEIEMITPIVGRSLDTPRPPGVVSTNHVAVVVDI